MLGITEMMFYVANNPTDTWLKKLHPALYKQIDKKGK